MSGNSGPGYKKHPEHKVDLEANPGRVRVTFNGEVIADTHAAIAVRESNYKPVLYVPVADIRQDVLKPSAHKSYCPFKGEASYWSIELGGERAESAVWSYEAPYDEVVSLKRYMAFYPDRGAQILLG